MKKKLNFAVLKSKQDDMERKELEMGRSGQSACNCDSECDGDGVLYAIEISKLHKGSGIFCPCGSIWVAFGLA